MTLSTKDLKHISELAYLDTHDPDATQLEQDVSAIMDFVEQLRSMNTTDVAPLFHPFGHHQKLRTDEVLFENCIDELEALAPLFEDGFYLVPKVIESEK